MAGSKARVVSDYEISSVHVRGFGVNQIAVQIRGHGKSVRRVHAWPTKKCLPGLRAVCVAVKHRYRSVSWGRVGSRGRNGLIREKSKPIVVCNESTSFFTTGDCGCLAYSSKCLWI